jgi:predicted CopG family antitoxin
MAVKTLTITVEAYRRIKQLKRPDESFSKLFIRLTEEKDNVADRFFGSARSSSKELDELRKTVKENKRAFGLSFDARQKKIQKRMNCLGI